MSHTSFPPPPDRDPADWNRLARYVAGECPADEAESLRRWAGASPANTALLADVVRAWADARTLGRPVDVDAMWRRAAVQLDDAATFGRRPGAGAISPVPSRSPLPLRVSPSSGGGARLVRRSTFVIRTAIAASIVLAIAVALSVHEFGAGLERSPLGGRSYVTTAGERLAVTLADGTQLTLAPASRLGVADGYGRSRRDVSLEGEAYFAVARDPKRPFTVRARGVTTEDIGTAFDVRAYPGDAATRIAVTEGAVAVSGAIHEQPLRPGDVAAVADTAVTVTHGVDMAALTAWTRGTLEFHNMPLRDALPELARWYALDIHLADTALGDRPLTASLTNTPASDAVTLVAATLGLGITRDGAAIILYQRP